MRAIRMASAEPPPIAGVSPIAADLVATPKSAALGNWGSRGLHDAAAGRRRAARTATTLTSAPLERDGEASQPPPHPHLLDILAGLRIQVERTPDKLRYCCRRGCIAVLRLEGDLLPGDIPTYSLRCDQCDRHLGYLHHRVSDELRTRVEQGRCSVPILKDNSLVR